MNSISASPLSGPSCAVCVGRTKRVGFSGIARRVLEGEGRPVETAPPLARQGDFAVRAVGVENIVATSPRPEEGLRWVIHADELGVTKADDGTFSILAIEEVNSPLPADRERITRRERAHVDLVRDRLDELAAGGRIHTVDTMAAASTLVGMVLWIPKWYQPTGRMADADRWKKRRAAEAARRDRTCAEGTTSS